MKKLILISLILFLLSFTACGKPEEAPAEKTVGVDIIETIVAHQTLLKKHQELEMLYERAKAREAKYLVAVRALEDANLAQGIELALLKSIEGERSGGYEGLLNELAALRAERKGWDRLSKQRYQKILEQYNELDALYPPKNFPDEETLIEWRENSGNVSELGYLGLQKLAMDDGYLISVCPQENYCVVKAGEYWYKITLGDEELVEKIGKVE